MSEQFTQNIIDKLFEDNPNLFVSHHLDSFNEFYNSGIKRIFREKNPIQLMKLQDPKTKDFALKCNMYLAGKNGDKLYYGKPIIYDNDREHFMYPNEARLRNMTYGITIHFDVDVEFFIREPDAPIDTPYPSEPTYTTTLKKIFLGRFPIMLYSDLCLLKGMSQDVRFEMGECKNDYGGYFIIDGKEKVIVSQEKFADNMLYVRDKVNDLYSHSADIRTVSEDASKPIRTLSVRMVSPTANLAGGHIVVNVPNVRKPVPLFILMRALGIVSDKNIIQHCLLDIEKYSSYVDLFIPSVHDAGMIFDQESALKYIATQTKGKTVPHALEILSDYFLPNIGEMNFKAKAYFIGYMVMEMLRVYTKEKKPTDRDSFRFKRVELPGSLIYDLFKEYYTIQQREIYQFFDKEYTFKQSLYKNNFIQLIEGNYKDAFGKRVVEQGFRKGYKGNWGSEEHTKRLGAVQALNRLTYNSAISHLRKLNLPLDASAKVVGPRLLHSSQWGIIDPVDTPDGGNVGLHKHLSIAAAITTNCSGKPLEKWLLKHNVKLIEEETPFSISNHTKVFVNGNWFGITNEPKKIVDIFKLSRRTGIMPLFTSIFWDINNTSLFFSTDSGRLCRPIFYTKENGKPAYVSKPIMEKIESGEFSWRELVTGFAKKKIINNNFYSDCNIYELEDMYDTKSFDSLTESQSIIEYLDTAETEGTIIALNDDDMTKKYYTHREIHPSLILGVMGNQVVFPENNQLPRDLFACGQMRQAVSLYHSNYQNRIDKMGVILNYGQMPLVKSRYLEKINKEQHPYGENVIAAIMCYGGYNVEDSILFNEASVKRGLFRTSYYNSYETREESSKVGQSQIDSVFTNIETSNVIGKKPGYDYSLLDKNGIARENSPVTEKSILIGKVNADPSNPEYVVDTSIPPKKGQLGFVDKSFITEGEEGYRVAKVRVRDERIPAIGDKFCSRCGQKGTIGLIIPEADMPFTSDGIRPDIIINPHALPSRMTIGQLVETLMGKACAMYGGYGDCTAFMNKGQKASKFGKMLTNVGFNSSGNQLLYNGQSGEQMKAEIFIGPTYYMRLKHMVKDKINHRALGPRTMLTRQTVQGRANDGGLRVGEMERDGIAAHGASFFLNESLMVRGDQYYMAVCNKTGTTAIYNESSNLFLSPQSDGPIKFIGTLDNGLNIENISKFGRSFSVIRIPYAFKLLWQELQTMQVQMRVITEDNIDQLTSMSFSDNIIRLTQPNMTPQLLVSNNKKILQTNKRPDITEKSAEPRRSITPETVDRGQYAPEINKSNPEELGWIIDEYDYEGNIWKSLIIGDDGEPTKYWNVANHDYLDPNEYAPGWIKEDTILNDGSQISVKDIILGLKVDQKPGNWNRVISRLREQSQTSSSPSPYRPMSPSDPDYVPPTPTDSPPYRPNYSQDPSPNSPVYKVPSDTSSPYRPISPSDPNFEPSDSPPFKIASDTPPSIGGNGYGNQERNLIININTNPTTPTNAQKGGENNNVEDEEVDNIFDAIEKSHENIIIKKPSNINSNVVPSILQVNEDDELKQDKKENNSDKKTVKILV